MARLIRGYDRDLLAHKIAWEGGTAAALDYGLKPEDIADADLRAAWAELRAMHLRIQPLIARFEALLRTNATNPGRSL